MSSTAIRPSYVNATTAIVATLLNNLASGNAVELPTIDNTSDLLLDIAIELAIVLQAGAFGGDQRINVYAVGSGNGGIFGQNMGVSGAVTLETPNDMPVLAYRSVGAGLINPAGTAKLFIPSLAAYFNGVVPAKWALIVENKTGVVFASAGHTVQYGGAIVQGIS